MKNTMTSALVLIALSAGAATAQSKPWESAKPANMTADHQNMAIEARKVQEVLPAGLFGDNPLQTNWEWRNGRNAKIPLSNMSISDLSSLVSGKYHIQSLNGEARWAARYYDPSGKTYFCEFSDSAAEYKEWSLDRYVATTNFGMAGIFHWDPKAEKTPKPPEGSAAWPLVIDGDKGYVFSYYWNHRGWVTEPGWLQEEYAAAFQESCPRMPRTSKVNNDQLGVSFTDLIREATPVRGIQTAFPNNPQDPLTAGMYYWYNAPE